ncbi:uncharacterized protein BDW47DRAFT_59982 [Aspergillus candidus]|uniref:Uncharacterized protein n=1 Tax=Aspergillus candidus TaxID=41067 RepID=A0A2I2F509_ASPCN|nr:hypothetical protein BDW47DRAFT_59982 [Aspergillus candidus]PLB35656.1 hypothetical protein BDW47DRAFT_59982 [Aspergillus candidus]
MAQTTPVHFFDITSTLPGPSKSWSPNTLKARMVLNYKRIPYVESFISYPDIAPLISHQFGLPPNAEGIPFTLPAISHPPTVTENPHGALMDSFAIAAHLDRNFPSPPLFPSLDASYALALAVDKLINKVAAKGRTLIIPRIADILDPRGREYFIKTRSAWFGMPLSQLRPRDEREVRAMVDGMKTELATIAQMLRGRIGKKGPFFEGVRPGYADFLVVAFLAWVERADKELWRELVSVGDGPLQALWDACRPWMEGQGEVKEWEVRR